MITKLKSRIRSAIQDALKSDSEAFSAESGDTITLSQENISAISSITIGGVTTDSDNYSFNSTTNVVTFDSGIISSGDSVVVYYTYYKYSDTELLDYIKLAFMYLDINQYYPHFELSTDEASVYPIPNLKEVNLIAVIIRILINPNWSEYRLPTVTVRYASETKTKEEKIAKVINNFKRSNGIIGKINL